MKRRTFLGCATVSAVGLTADKLQAQTEEKKKRIRCKITVLKRTLNQDLYLKYRGKKGRLCQVFKEDQEFLVESAWSPPEGFCAWAWADIRTYLQGLFAGQKYGGAEVFVACCTDGFRPVLFKLERI